MTEYKGITANVKDQQRLLNMSLSRLIIDTEIRKEFNAWFDAHSFRWVPDFAKPLIKKWVYSGYYAAHEERVSD